jgi:hypothetical protein
MNIPIKSYIYWPIRFEEEDQNVKSLLTMDKVITISYMTLGLIIYFIPNFNKNMKLSSKCTSTH